MHSTNPTDQPDDRLSVLLVVPREYYYIPKFLAQLVESPQIRVVGITTVPPALGTQGVFGFAARLFRSFGPRVFAQHVGFYLRYLATDHANRLLSRGRPYSPKTLALRHDIEYRHVADVNAPSYIDYAKSKNPDVLVSVAATQKFGPELLSVPANCAINIHSSLLPAYRGVSPSFWALLNDEDATGITVHYMAPEFDTGDVIVQRPLPIEPGDSLHTLNTRVAEHGSAVLVEALERIHEGAVEPKPLDLSAGGYYSVPKRDHVKEFLATGRRFF
ncbi:methionyl-tRNA formyltransferase [Haladaptatus sp. DYSN1]|uniref:methionyl-tRNA formyltransferase n=1 Tax=unclassified Haladaptatus TaxID=2622732 RepID=UPI002406B325|nr:formyltransferase family protein [Haladaptatus sp. DYSN1]